MSRNLRTNEMKYIILNYLFKNKNKSFTKRRLFFATQLGNQNAAVYNKYIDDLIKSEYLVHNSSNETVQWNSAYFICKLHVQNRERFGYLNIDQTNLSNNDKYRLIDNQKCYPIDGDTVIVKIMDPILLNGEIVSVIKRTTKQIIGTVIKQYGTSFVIPKDKKRYTYDFFVSSDMESQYDNYANVNVKIDEFDTGFKPRCIITKVFNDSNQADKHIQVLSKNNYPIKFSEGSIKRASTITPNISKTAAQERGIYSNVFMIGSKETLDRAYSIQKKGNCYELLVFVPDVSAKVMEYSPLSKDAYQRGFACNLLNENVEIFPKKLLNEKIRFIVGHERLAIGFKLVFSLSGLFESFDVFKAQITPTHKFDKNDYERYVHDYNEEFEMLASEHLDSLMLMYDLFNAINKDTLIFKEKSYIKDINNDQVIYNYNSFKFDDFEYLIKVECEKATNLIFKESRFPAIHEYYALPSEFELNRLESQCDVVYISTEIFRNKILTASDLKEYINSISNDNIREGIITHFEKLLKAPVYSKEAIYNIRYGNASCPILDGTTNYAALYNQRLLKRYIDKTLFNDNVENTVLKNIDRTCNHLSKMAKQVLNINQEYLNSRLNVALSSQGNIFYCTAYMIAPNGVYVTCSNGIYGLVKFDDYEISDREFNFANNGARYTIRLGDRFTIAYDHHDIKSNKLIFQYLNKEQKKRQEIPGVSFY